jgi:hypothetical protein
MKPTESRWQRLVRSLLYGANVDRAVKAKARLGLIIVVFALVYGVIAGRPSTASLAKRCRPPGRTFSTATA